MKQFTKTIIVVAMLLVVPMKQWGQERSQIKVSEFGFQNIGTIEERTFLLHSVLEKGYYCYRNAVKPNTVDVYIPSDASEELSDFDFFFDNLYYNELPDFSNLDKSLRGELFIQWRQELDDELFRFIYEDFIREIATENATCETALPFCTDNGAYSFPAGVNSGSPCGSTYNASCSEPYKCTGTPGQSTNCLYTAPNPAFYYLKIATTGNLNIKIYSSPRYDIDFDCWGPFDDPLIACSQLSCSNIVDCSYAGGSADEFCHINNAVVGKYYILLLTNYGNQACNIIFENVGTGTTDCGIMPPLVENTGPYCVGETINLSANGQAGATYSWTGPGGFTSTQQNPTRPNCTMQMAGIYTCTITVGSQTNSATTEVVVIPQPTANFTYTSVCRGTPTQFTSTSTTNPSGQQIQTYNWNFGDGQTGTGPTVNHTYAQAGNYTVTLTVSCGGHCTSQKTNTVPVYAAPVASATAQPSTVIYGGTSTLTANAGTTGSFNFHWEPADMVVNPNSQTTQTVPLQATQTYTVTVTNPQGGCNSTAQVTVNMEGSNMSAFAMADQNELCEGQSTALHAQPSGGTGNYTFNWTPANTLDDPTSQNPVATPPVGTTTYTCAVSDGITGQNVSVTITVHPNEEVDIFETICENSSYNFFGQDLQTPGEYSHTLETQFGCDSIIHLHLDNWQTYETAISDRFCQGETYHFFDQNLYGSGIYYHTLESVHGCDSVIRLSLTQDPVYEVFLTESTCEGGPGYYFAPLDIYFPPSPFPNILVFETTHGCDSVVFLTIEEAEYNSKTYNVSLCAEEYTWASNGHTYYESGVYYDTISYSGSCDSTVVLNLELRPSYDIEERVTSCDTYRWKNDVYNVDMTFSESTTYTHHYVNNFGCDSEVTLFLTINDHDEISFTLDDEDSCDEYFWDPNGHEIVYTDHQDPVYNLSGTYKRIYLNKDGCDSIVTMTANFDYTPHPTAIYPMDVENTTPHWVVTAAEFQINAYDFNLWDENPNCSWDTVVWTCDEAPNWVYEPFGDKGKCCKVYVLNHVDDTIWLKAHAFNRCAPDEGIEQKYWLVCSFYGVEENGQNGTQNLGFDVVPNPNNGRMTLNFEHLTGKVNVKVYDMKGSLIDRFETYNGSGSCSHDYQMKHGANGFYFFVATSKEGTIAKKVVIQK